MGVNLIKIMREGSEILQLWKGSQLYFEYVRGLKICMSNNFGMHHLYKPVKMPLIGHLSPILKVY